MKKYVFSLFFTLYAVCVNSLDLCSESTIKDCETDTIQQACDGPYALTWKAYSSCDSTSKHFHFDAIADIPTLLNTDLGDGYRTPTIKELVTIMGYGGMTLPVIESWITGSGYLLSSTYGTTSSGVKTIMAIDLSNKEVVELSLSGTDSYYLAGVKTTP